jgi:hypothetical protein
VEQDEDSIETIYFSAIPHDWFAVDNSSEQKHFLFPPPPNLLIANLSAYNWPYNTFRRYFYPTNDWMEYTASSIGSREKSSKFLIIHN